MNGKIQSRRCRISKKAFVGASLQMRFFTCAYMDGISAIISYFFSLVNFHFNVDDTVLPFHQTYLHPLAYIRYIRLL